MGKINHAEYLPSFRDEDRTSQTWASGNTKTITDAHVKANSNIMIMHTSLPAGRWYVTVSAGSFTITSSDAESNATFTYVIL